VPRATGAGVELPAWQNFNTLASQGLAMLVLSRKKDEKIIIGDNITLMVIEIRGDKVRLGIDAPKDVSVHREEVYNAIKRERNGASGASIES
jgi:carbon storage regulator